MNPKKSEFETIILAALLHDIGKFYLGESLCDEFKKVKLKGHGHAKWSACFVRKYQEIFRDTPSLIDMALYHGQPGKDKDYNGETRDENKIGKALLISIADKLSSKERRKEGEVEAEKEEKEERMARSKIPLVSVFNEIRLGLKGESNQKKAYFLNSLDINQESIFPRVNYPDESLSVDACSKACKRLNSDFGKIQNDDHTTILHLLYKHIWATPSATSKVGITPDVSLFDHARTTAAIALCLFKNYKCFSNKYAETLHNALIEDFKIKIGKRKEPLSQGYEKTLKEPLFLFLAADIFGIQDFIYAPTNIPGTSKRLRGRSFYLSVLTDTVARYIVYHPDIGLSLVNILYCAGGNTQILLPNTQEFVSKLNEILMDINKKLYEKFNGKLGVVFAGDEISSFDFETWDEVLMKANEKMNLEKKKKMQSHLKEVEGEVLFPKDEVEGRKDICKSCGATISYGEEICHLCKINNEIGENLPRTKAIIYHQGAGKIESINDNFQPYEIDFNPFGKVTLIIKKKEGAFKPSFKISGDVRNLEYYKLNDTEEFVNSAILENAIPSFGFKFLGNIVPRDEDGSVMEFEKIAERSDGADKLGILKMDVDLLGLMLQIGLSHKEHSDRTISRLATLSRMMELFFSGYIHRICEAKEFENRIYIVFSGGDDLFIVGPWSKIPLLAKKIYDDFREYTCQNPDITLSGGIFICNPKFPVKRFAYLVNDELEASKEGGRDRCTFFGETVPWLNEKEKDKKFSFEELITGFVKNGEKIKGFAEELSDYVSQGKIARGFLHELLQIHPLYFSNSKKNHYLYLPRLIWQLVRNIKDKDIRDKLFKKLITSMEGIKWMENIKIPVSYALLKSRRR